MTQSMSRVLIPACKSEHLQTNALPANSNLPLSSQFHFNYSTRLTLTFTSFITKAVFSFQVKLHSTFWCGTSSKKVTGCSAQTKDFRDEWTILLSKVRNAWRQWSEKSLCFFGILLFLPQCVYAVYHLGHVFAIVHICRFRIEYLKAETTID